MKNLMTKAGLGVALGLCAFASPVFADAVIDFSSTGSSGSIVTPGDSGTQTLTSLNVTNWNQFTVSGAGEYNGTWTINSGGSSLVLSENAGNYYLTMSVTSASCASCTGWSLASTSDVNFGAIFTVDLGSTAPTGAVAGGGSAITVTIANATSLTETASFLSDLGLSTSPISATTTGSDQLKGNSVTGTGPYTFTPNSSVLDTDINASFVTPEPVSFLLMGGGLLLVGLTSLVKKQRAQSVTAK